MGEFFFLWGLFVSKLLTALLLLGLGLMIDSGNGGGAAQREKNERQAGAE